MRLWVPLLLTLWATTVHAGNNRYGQAYLSLAPEEILTDMAGMPSGAFPIYLRIEGASDIRGLSVRLVWTAGEEVPGGFRMVAPPDTLTTKYGYATLTPPGAGFPQESRFRSTIVFPATTSSRSVVAYWFAPTDKTTRPMSFCLLSVKALDSGGEVDELALMEGIRIGGGYLGGCPVTANSLARGRLVLRLRPDAVEPIGGANESAAEALVPPLVMDSLRVAGVQSIRRLFPWRKSTDPQPTNLIGEPVLLPDLSTYVVADIAPTAVVREAAAATDGIRAVAAAYPVPLVQYYYAPNDTLFPRQWGLDNTQQAYGCELPLFQPDADINAPEAYTKLGGAGAHPGAGVRIGILDSGVSSRHPDFGGRVTFGFNAAGHVQGFDGWASEDSLYHGTGVAGIAAASGDNTAGVAGIAWDATIVPIRLNNSPHVRCGEDVLGYLIVPAAAGLGWSGDAGRPVEIVNMSFGSYGPTFPPFADACLNSLLRGQFLVAASGNDNYYSPSPDTLPYPARFAKRVFTVGAIFGNGLRWDDHIGPAPSGGWDCWSWIPDPQDTAGGPMPCGSNYGPHLDAVAPGGHMIATLRSWSFDRGPVGNRLFPCNDGYYTVGSCAGGLPDPDSLEFGGTSSAAPMTSGVAALLMGAHPGELLGEDVGEVLRRTARHPSGLDFSDWYGWGLIRADEALGYLDSTIIDHCRATNLVVQARDTVGITFSNGTPGVPDGNYYAVRYRMRGNAAFRWAFGAPPDVWVRASGTAGLLDVSTFDYLDDVPFGRILDCTTTGITLETFVYDVLDPSLARVAWYPCDTASAAVAATAVGRPASWLSVSPDHGLGLRLAVSRNPSVGRAELLLTAPGPGVAQITIFDVQGRVVQRLGPGVVADGTTRFVWDGTGRGGARVAGGVFYARAWLNGRHATVKLVILPGR